MKRKVLKSLMSLVLTATLLVGDAGLAFASEPVTAVEDAAEEVQAEETESESETEIAEVTESEPETEIAEVTESEPETENAEVTESEPETEVAETEAAEREQEETVVREEVAEPGVETEGEAVGAQTKPSKVIGVKGTPSYNTYTDTLGKAYHYVYVNQSASSVLVKGTEETYKDTATEFYKYNGTYYRYCYKADALTGYVRLNNPIVVKSGVMNDYRDAETGLYKIDGALYYTVSGRTVNGKSYVYAYKSYECVSLGLTANSEESDELKDKYAVKDTAGNVFYYKVNGGFYRSVYYSYSSYYGYRLYALKSDEISLAKTRVNLTWNAITDNSVIVNSAKIPMSVGYQLEINGKVLVPESSSNVILDEKSGTVHQAVISSSSSPGSRLSYVTVGVKEKVSVRVRAIYYHDKEVIYSTTEGGSQSVGNVHVADMYGAWSDVYTYTGTGMKAASVVKGVSAKKSQDGKKIELTWNPVAEASSYRIYQVKSDKKLAITNEASFKQFYYHKGALYDAFINSYGTSGTPVLKTYTTSTSSRTYSSDVDGTAPYNYFAVTVSTALDGYFEDYTYSNIASCVVSAAANTPQLKNFKVISLDNGNSAELSWTPVNANIAIYVIEGTTVPTFYNYEILKAKGYYQDNTEVSLTYNSMTDAQRGQIKKYVTYSTTVTKGTTNSSNGSLTISSSWGLKPGVKYTFVAFTYDDDPAVNAAKKSSIGSVTYNAPSEDQNGIQTYTKVSVPMTYYTATGKVAKATYTPKITRPTVYYTTTKTSIKLNLSASNYTGYEIYRLSGKKYKKIATVTQDSYTDKDLKADTTYSYKVRAYFYDTDTKKTSYSTYYAISVTTSATKNFDVKAVKASKTSAKLTWTKVSGATKYEIYRATGTATDRYVIGRQLNYGTNGNYAYALSNSKYTLVKTITKAATKTYTDKKLKAGETYTYLVIAHYKNAKKDTIMYDSASVKMELSAPQNVTAVNKGKKVTVKWDADKFASKYELRWKITDKYGKQAENWKTATSKKASKTISINSGEYLSVQVRAYGSNKTYSSWSSVYATNSLATVSGIKAVNVAKTGAVKITWKKVSGAKYYKVYRSTDMAVYNSDDKRYIYKGSLIAKESNDDKGSYSEVTYREYYNISGSVTTTTAYDYAQLKSGVTYYYTVVAFGEKGTEIASYTTNASVLKTYASGKPASVVYKLAPAISSLVSNKKNTVTVKYGKVTGAKKYYVYRSTKKSSGYKLIGSTAKTSYTDKKATSGKTYYYKIVVKGTNALKADFEVTSAVKTAVVKASTKVTLNKKTLSIKKGATATLKATVKPKNSTDKLTWSSSNKKIVTVDANGKIKGIKKGTATITVKTASKKTAKCKVTVK